jgi:protein-S-isoprenylcysteine O-methyltransferase Ste14
MTAPVRVSPFALFLTALYLLAWPALVFVLAGNWRWPEGWMFGVWFLGMCASTLGWLYRHDPSLLAERYRRPGTGGQSRRDLIIVVLLILGFVLWIVLMPLDAVRFHWTPPQPDAVKAAGLVLLAAAWFLLFRALTDNTYASPLARIQRERGHHVVSTGVYALVRHPMYLGAILMFVGGPLLTGAASALLLAAALSILIAVRIGGEESLLVRELPGYDAYRHRVRYRLLPFVW